MLRDIIIKITEMDVSRLSNTEVLNLLISISSLAVAVFSFGVSMIALVYAGYQFYLKIGTSFYGVYSLTHSSSGRQRYISEVIIENRKDKAVAVSFIYLRIRSNIYLELVDYESSPRIVAPFETIKIDLQEGVSGYIASTYKVDLDAFLADRNVKKSLMVATPQGLSKVKRYKKFWNVYIESLRNHFIVPVRPVKKFYAGKEYSDSLQFVVLEENNEGKVKEYFLYRRMTYSINGVSVPVDEFKSAEEMEVFLRITAQAYAEPLKVRCVGYTYSDFEKYEEVEIPHGGFWMTHVVGKFYTWLHGWSLAIRNKRRK